MSRLRPQERCATKEGREQVDQKRADGRLKPNSGPPEADTTDTVTDPARPPAPVSPPPTPPPTPPPDPVPPRAAWPNRPAPYDGPRSIEQLAIRLRTEMLSLDYLTAHGALREVTGLYRLPTRPPRELMLAWTRWSEVAERLRLFVREYELGVRAAAVIGDGIELHMGRLRAAPLEPWATWLGRLIADTREMADVASGLSSDDPTVRTLAILAIEHAWATRRCEHTVRNATRQTDPNRVRLTAAAGLADALLALHARPLPTGESLGELLDRFTQQAVHIRQREVDERRSSRTPLPPPRSQNRSTLQSLVRAADTTARTATRAAMVRLLAERVQGGNQPLDPQALAVLRALVAMAEGYSAAAEANPPAWVIDSAQAAVCRATGRWLARSTVEAILAACRGAADGDNAVARVVAAGADPDPAAVQAAFTWLHRLGQRGMPTALAAEMEYWRPDAGAVNVAAVRNALNRLRYYFRGQSPELPAGEGTPDQEEDGATDAPAAE